MNKARKPSSNNPFKNSQELRAGYFFKGLLSKALPGLEVAPYSFFHVAILAGLWFLLSEVWPRAVEVFIRLNGL